MKYSSWVSSINYKFSEPVQKDKAILMYGIDSLLMSEISNQGYAIAPSLVISSKFFEEFFNDKTLKNSITDLFKEFDNKKDRSLLPVFIKKVREDIVGCKLSDVLKKEITDIYEHLKESLLIKSDKGLSLRLITLDESNDSYEIYSEIANIGEFEFAVKQAISLGFMSQELFSNIDRGIYLPEAFPIMIQHVNKWSVSGNAFCFDFDQMDDSVVSIQVSSDKRPESFRNINVEVEYRFDRHSGILMSKAKNTKIWTVDVQGKHIKNININDELIGDDQLKNIAKKIDLLQSNCNDLVCYEWVIDQDQIIITRAYPILEDNYENEISVIKPFIVGKSINPGTCVGNVKILDNIELNLINMKDVKEYEEVILISEVFNKKYIETYRKCAGLIFEVSSNVKSDKEMINDLGIPVISATKTAMNNLKNGILVTLNADMGVAYLGDVRYDFSNKDIKRTLNNPTINGVKMYELLCSFHMFDENKVQMFDGIGLLRSEYILNWLNLHPRDILMKKMSKDYSQLLGEGLENIVKSYYPKPVSYQLHDVYSSSIHAGIKNQDQEIERLKVNGYRGVKRILNELETLDMEIDALKSLYGKGLNYISIVLPFAQDKKDIKNLIDYIYKVEHLGKYKPKIWIKCEVPDLALSLATYSDDRVVGIIYDLDSLGQLLTGHDINSLAHGHKYEDNSEGLLMLIGQSIAKMNELGYSTNVSSESGRLSPELIEVAIRAGVRAVTVLPEMADEVNKLIASIERRIL